MPHILHLIETGGPGGAETVLAGLAEAMSHRGWRSTVVLPRRGWLYERLCKAGVETRVFSSKHAMDIRFLLWLIRQIRGIRPDLVHAHFLGSGVYGALACALTGSAPLVCTLHGESDVDPEDPLLGVKAKILSKPQNRVVYVSHYLRRTLEPLLGPGILPGLVIHNGVELPDPMPLGGEPPDLGIESGDHVIGAVGNIRPAKDYPNLLRSAALVCRQRGNVQFVVVGQGEGPLLDGLLRLRHELGLEERVHFLGFREDVSSILNSFRVFVSSSRSEGLPLATVEAMARGKPVVATDCGGVPEVIEGGKTGILVPAKDPQALADGILWALDRPRDAEKLGAAAKRKVQTDFSVSKMLRTYEDLYRELVGQEHHADE